MTTPFVPVFAWPKPSEDLDGRTLIRLLNLYKPAGLIACYVDGGGSAITAGQVRYLPCMNFKAKIMGWTVIGDAAGGTCTFDVWKVAGPAIPTVADTIVAAAPPELTAAALVNSATTVPTWTGVQIAENDVLAIQLSANSLHTSLALVLSVARGDDR